MGIKCHREGLAVTAMAGSATRPLKTHSGQAGVSWQIAVGLKTLFCPIVRYHGGVDDTRFS